MTTSIVVQSLGNVVKATAVSFTRQIILFIPIATLLCVGFKYGIYGVLYAGFIADSICFVVCIFIFGSEYKKFSKTEKNSNDVVNYENDNEKMIDVVVTISREYGSGGRYVGELLAKKLGVNFYDKALISLAAKESGLSEDYISEIEQSKNYKYENNNDDRLFIAEANVIKRIAKKSCVIVGICADYVLKDNDAIKVFLYSDKENKVKRAIKYYGLNAKTAEKEIDKINKKRAKHYKYYTNREWKDLNNYDLMLNVDKIGVENTVLVIEDYINSKN